MLYESGIVPKVEQLRDTDISTPADGDLFQYNGSTNKWVNSSDVWDTMAQNGAHNLIPYPYAHGISRTNGGATFTVDNKGVISVIATGSTVDGWFTLTTGRMLTSLEVGKSYILSGGLSSSITLNLYFIDSSNQQIGSTVVCEGSPVTITVPSGTDTVGIALHVSATVPSAQLVYPMIRLATDANTEYKPYAPTNRDCVSYRVNSVLGAHNLLPNRATTQTTNGVTFTINSDGSVTVNTNGVTTANAFIELLPNTKEFAFNENYILTGCPAGGGDNTYGLHYRIGNDSNDSWVASADDFGTGGVNLVSYDSSTQHFRVYISIRTGVTLNNVKFYPMIRRVEDTDTTYAPYAPTNRDLVYVRDGWQKNGAYNICPNNATSQVVNGITYSVNSNKTVSISGTQTASGDSHLVIGQTEKLDAGTYKIVGCPSGGSWSTYVLIVRKSTDGSTWSLESGDLGRSGLEVTVTEGTYLKLEILIYASATVTDLVYKPMITTDLNATYNDYVPYAKTNRELTEDLKGAITLHRVDITANANEKWSSLIPRIKTAVGAYVETLPSGSTVRTLDIVMDGRYFESRMQHFDTSFYDGHYKDVIIDGSTFAISCIHINTGTYRITMLSSAGATSYVDKSNDAASNAYVYLEVLSPNVFKS